MGADQYHRAIKKQDTYGLIATLSLTSLLPTFRKALTRFTTSTADACDARVKTAQQVSER